jgi:hypothetical protein
MRILKAPHVPIIAFPSSPLWHTSNPKAMIASICVSRVARQLEVGTGMYTGGGRVKKLKRDVEGVDPYDFFAWPQYNQCNQSRSLCYCSVQQCLSVKNIHLEYLRLGKSVLLETIPD